MYRLPYGEFRFKATDELRLVFENGGWYYEQEDGVFFVFANEPHEVSELLLDYEEVA